VVFQFDRLPGALRGRRRDPQACVDGELSVLCHLSSLRPRSGICAAEQEAWSILQRRIGEPASGTMSVSGGPFLIRGCSSMALHAGQVQQQG